MVTKGMQRIILLKDVPSNIVEEAIVVLKDNKLINRKSKAVEFFDSENKFARYQSDKDFVLKEAQNVIFEYIRDVENKKDRIDQSKLEKKYKRLVYSISVISFLFAIDIILKFI